MPPEGATAQREFAGDWVVARGLHSSKLFAIDAPVCYTVFIPKRKRKKMKTITITWKAFGEPTSATFQMDIDAEAREICSLAFRNTNLYEGAMWDIVEPLLPEDRTHTSLSVGDEVTVDGEVFRCMPEGWSSLQSDWLDTAPF